MSTSISLLGCGASKRLSGLRRSMWRWRRPMSHPSPTASSASSPRDSGSAQAVIHEPDVMILDEPTEGLDPRQRSDTAALIRELGKEHTVILSTHILPEVEATCDRVLIINEGAIVASDTTEG